MTRADVPAVARFAFFAAAAAAVLVTVSATRADVDLWGHLRFGLDIVEQGRFDRQDPYSFTSDRPWVNHEWLSEVAFALAWQGAGNAGLILLKLSCMLGALAIVAAVLRRHGVPPAAQALVLAIALLGVVPRSTHIRPQLFSVLLFAALMAVCDRSERGRPRGLLWAVPIMGAWANLHGGWIAGLATLSMWAAGLSWMRRREGAAALAVLAVPLGAAGATLITPYGTGLWTFLLDTVRLGRAGIPEWGPIWTNPARTLVWACLTAAVAFAALRDRPANPARLLIPALWGAAAFRVNRLDAFFALSAVVLLAPRLSRRLPDSRAAFAWPQPRVRAAVLGAMLLVIAALPWTRKTLTCVEVTPSWWPEPEAVAFVRHQRLAGRMVTHFNWGEYGIWHLPPSVKVSFDGRRETVYSDRVIAGHLELYAGTEAGLAYLDELQADYVWLPRGLAVNGVLERRGWIPLFIGAQSIVFGRSGYARAASTSAPTHRCFPGP